MWAISQGNYATEIAHFKRMALNGLSSNPLTLLESRLLRGREGSSLLVHTPITLLLPHFVFLYTLHFLSYSDVPSFLSYLSLLFFLAIFSLAFLCLSLVVFPTLLAFFACFFPFFTVHSQGIFILPFVMSFTVLPLNYFYLSFPD